MNRIADNNTRTKHNKEIAFFNALVIDLKMHIVDYGDIWSKSGDIDMPRLEEATKHLAKIAECKEQVRWK